MTAIGAENLHFSYDRDQILTGADFTLPKGSFAVITGPSGIGKSTLLKLLLGVFHPDRGGLHLECGTERMTLDRSTRELFAYVPQGNLLLSGTLRENLTIARPEATEEELRQAVHISAMEEYLSQLPEGLDTVLGESGAGLSEGQMQRLAIARALIRNPKVIILDEATSALDSVSEREIQNALDNLMRGRTTFVVAHRLSTIRNADKIAVVADGVCKEYGTYEELMEKKGAFYELRKLQIE
jgi:ATP-binding cassette subfamily B protein